MVLFTLIASLKRAAITAIYAALSFTFLITIVTTGSAGTLDTLALFNADGSKYLYGRSGIEMQAGRFEVSATGQLHEIRILLTGDNDTGTARIRVFGHEGGSPAPFYERDITEPVVVTKSRKGLEWVTIPLASVIEITQRQFFIAVDRLSPDVALVTDKTEQPILCDDSPELYRNQYLKGIDGRWMTGPYSYAIEVVIEYDHDPEAHWLSDVTFETGIIDTSNVAGGISWGDFNSDTWIDLLCNGRLYQNNGGAFEDVTDEFHLTESPLASVFIDINSDNRVDILFIGNNDAVLAGKSIVYLQTETGIFEEHSIVIPKISNPTTVSISDINLDGKPDLFIGQGFDSDGNALPSYLLMNTGEMGFTDKSSELAYDETIPSVTTAAQWVDIDHDGFLDLYVIRNGMHVELWRGDENGELRLFHHWNAIDQRNLLGGDWQDVDGDSYPDLIAPEHFTVSDLAGNNKYSASLSSVHISDLYAASRLSPQHDYEANLGFSERRGSGNWCDIDNDGNLDIYFSSASPCRNAELYLNHGSGAYEQSSSQMGLLHLAAGPDAVWVDYDNDGKLDLATLVHGKLRLFRNAIDPAGNFIELDFSNSNVSGATVVLFSGEHRQVKYSPSGRGLLMQDPQRIHFGIGNKSTIDSIQITWPGGDIHTQYDIPVNSLYKIEGRTSTSSNQKTLSTAYPNPFNEYLTISFELLRKSEVRIEIYDVKGSILAVLAAEVFDGGIHSIKWDAVDNDGKPLSQGVYFYRVIAGADTYSRSVTLGR